MNVLHWPFLALRKGFLFSILIVLFPAALAAERPVDLGEVVVEDKMDDKEPSLDRSAAATVLIPEESREEAHSVSELLEESPGVYVKRYNWLDDMSALSIRGSSASQVEIYIDDIPLMNAQGTMIDLGVVPLSVVDRIEVYRGGSPGKIPESTIGGVVLLKTKSKIKKREVSAYGYAGSFETVKGRATYADSIGIVTPVIAFDHTRSLGDFLYNNDNGTRFNTSDDALVRRQNNDFSQNSLFTKFLFDLPRDATISLTNIFFQKDEGVPGLATRQSLTARLETLRNTTSVVAEKKGLFTEKLSGHADVFFDYLNSRFRDPMGQIGPTPEETDDNTYRAGGNLKGTVEWTPHQIMTAYAAERSEFFVPYDGLATPPNGPESSRHSINAGLEEEMMFFSERLSVIPSVRVENLFNRGDLGDRSDHQLSAKLGLSLRMVDRFYFKANGYRGFRNPTFAELFGNTGMLQGNPALEPEKAVNFDAGLSYDLPEASWFDGGHIEATYYRNYVSNLIQYVQTSNFTAKAFNMNKAVIQGVEAMAAAKFAKRFSLLASYTFQEAKDDSGNPDTQGKYLPGRPKNELYAKGAWQEEWLGWFKTSLWCDLNFISGNYLDTQNLLLLTNRTLLGSGVTFNFIGHIALSFWAQNILNDRVSDVIGFPMPGRSYWGSLEIKI